MSSLLAGQDLVAEYPLRGGWLGRKRAFRAVNGVTLEVNAGETVALVGESGSGKSTLGRLLLGLLPPNEGTVLYQGQDVADLRGEPARAFRRDVQAVFQDTSASLNPRKTIAASVAVPLRYNLRLPPKEAAVRAIGLLERVGLDPAIFAGRYPHELSGGQRQRVVIARAIASQPRFVVADEPVSALDVSVRAQILRLMRDLQRDSGLAYLFITHDLGTVRAIADRVLVLHQGTIVEAGPVARIFGAPEHPYTQTLLAATPVADPAQRKRQHIMAPA